MLPAHSTSSGSETGDPTQDILGEIAKYVEAGDIVIDGGNAFFGDTERRYEHFGKKSKNIYLHIIYVIIDLLCNFI